MSIIANQGNDLLKVHKQIENKIKEISAVTHVKVCALF